MEATICSAPEVPTVPQRQATQLPDAGANITKDDRLRQRRAMFAGLSGSAAGALGNPNMAKPKLG